MQDSNRTVDFLHITESTCFRLAHNNVLYYICRWHFSAISTTKALI